MWSALWQALMTFFSHLKTKQHTEEVARKTAEQITEATKQAAQNTQLTEAERHREDEKVRGAPDTHDARINKWMRD